VDCGDHQRATCKVLRQESGCGRKEGREEGGRGRGVDLEKKGKKKREHRPWRHEHNKKPTIASRLGIEGHQKVSWESMERVGVP